jgi:hypothetical protein
MGTDSEGNGVVLNAIHAFPARALSPNVLVEQIADDILASAAMKLTAAQRAHVLQDLDRKLKECA